MRPGKPQKVAQVMNKQQARFDLIMMIDTIDVDTDSLFHKLPFLICKTLEKLCVRVLLCQFEAKVNRELGSPCDRLAVGYCRRGLCEERAGRSPPLNDSGLLSLHRGFMNLSL